VLGTAFYMSPEQAQAFRDVDGRTDLYSLGSILFEMLTGRPPHTGTVYEAVLIDICTKDAPDIRTLEPDVPDAVAEVVEKALARNREQRFQDANELYDALALAAPGLLRTGGIGATRAAFSENPSIASSRRSTPRSKPEPQIESATDARSGPVTAAGTAVNPQGSTHTRRTVVTAVVAALAAFAITVILMANRGKNDAEADPRGRTLAGGSATAEPKPSAANTATVTPALSGKPDAGAAHKPSTKPKPLPIVTNTKPNPTAPKPTGVATGLVLDPKGP
jgi:serine/threonine-protein kinase